MPETRIRRLSHGAAAPATSGVEVVDAHAVARGASTKWHSKAWFSGCIAAEPQLQALLREIDALTALPENWDGEGASRITRETATGTKELLLNIADEAQRHGLAWKEPTVTPMAGGGIELAWEVGDRWVSLVVKSGAPGVECVKQTEGEAPAFQVESRGDAVHEALWALSGS